MTCSDVVRELTDYLDGDLSPALVQSLERHLCDCHDCRLVVDTTKKTIHIYRNSQPLPLPADVEARLHQALASKLNRRFSWALRSSSPG